MLNFVSTKQVFLILTYFLLILEQWFSNRGPSALYAEDESSKLYEAIAINKMNQKKRTRHIV